MVLNDMDLSVVGFSSSDVQVFTNEDLIGPSPYTVFTQMQDDCNLQQSPRKYTYD